jgi:hypothetical protein
MKSRKITIQRGKPELNQGIGYRLLYRELYSRAVYEFSKCIALLSRRRLQRGHLDLNQGSIELPLIALPLSYTPIPALALQMVLSGNAIMSRRVNNIQKVYLKGGTRS